MPVERNSHPGSSALRCSVRGLRPADAEAFGALIRIAFAEWAVDPPPSALRVTAADIRSHLDAGGGGITTDPNQAGLLWAEKEGGLYVSRVAVHPGQRRQGLAVALLKEAEAEAYRRSLPFVWLSTRLAMESNRRLFRHCGFTEGSCHAHPGFAEHTFIDLTKHVTSKPTPSPNVMSSTL